MDVGVYYTLRNAAPEKWFRPWPEYHAVFQDQVTEVDRLGFSSMGFAEHHFDPDGYNNSVIVIMTMVALKTKQIRIGQNILTMPYYHPVRLAEDLATIDIISGGRVMLNAGQVGFPFDDEFYALGLNPKHRPSLVEENIEVVRKCWTEESFSFHGKRWDLEDVRMYPKPLQKPHPPIYTTAGSAVSMDRAARMGLNACGRGGSGAAPSDGEKWRTWESDWHTALAKYGRNPADYMTNCHGQLYVTDDPEREWAKHKDALLYRRNYQRFNGRRPYVEVAGKERMDVPEDLPEWQSIFLTPEEAVKRIRASFAESAPDEMLLTADNPGIPLEDSLEYLRLFAEKVMPHIADLGRNVRTQQTATGQGK